MNPMACLLGVGLLVAASHSSGSGMAASSAATASARRTSATCARCGKDKLRLDHGSSPQVGLEGSRRF
jgi:hypothetical protein